MASPSSSTTGGEPDAGTTGASGADRWTAALWFAVAGLALGRAIQMGNGNGNPASFLWLTVACVAALLALAVPAPARFAVQGDRACVALLGVVLGLQFGEFFAASPAIYLQASSRGDFMPYFYGLTLAAVLAGGAIVAPGGGWLGRWHFPLLLAIHFALGAWLLRLSPAPAIDVWAWHREAFSQLAHGHNPYTGTMPDIYGHGMFYAPGAVVNGRVQTGFPYPPLSLLLAGIGHLAAGEYRFANLAAITGAGALMAYARPSARSFAAAAAFLFTQRFFFVLEQGWSDPLAVLLLSAVVFVWHRARRWLWVALGLLFAVKQYLVLAAPLVLLLYPRPLEWRSLTRELGKAVGLAAALTLPVALLDPAAFFHSLVGFQAAQPFRADSLSFPAQIAQQGGGAPVLWGGFAAVPVVWGLALWRAPRSAAGFAGATAILFLFFFAFSKQAFANYYFFVLGASLCAVASATQERSVTTTTGLVAE
jgi:hypothetical protein